MAANYTNVTARRTVQVLGPTEVIDVEEVGFYTIPTNIYAQVEVPYQAWLSEGPAAWVEPLATAIEGMISGGLATGGTFVQDVDASGLLTDYIEFTVTYTPTTGLGLPFTTAVDVPVAALTLDTGLGAYTGTSAADLVSAAYNQLVATANE